MICRDPTYTKIILVQFLVSLGTYYRLILHFVHVDLVVLPCPDL